MSIGDAMSICLAVEHQLLVLSHDSASIPFCDCIQEIHKE